MSETGYRYTWRRIRPGCYRVYRQHDNALVGDDCMTVESAAMAVQLAYLLERVRVEHPEWIQASRDVAVGEAQRTAA